ncbi:hypothetical protein H4R34_000709 [Dimargaris verticillata]|uniref:P-loop containing nucleoside triphosphate hydrolase protein n=1 Tax=Dimargaris verticillata TaxID=2761393 RepID=A0A9W8B9U4_9FUNG|nr:hypothetical protein H4R34_000709 [Dimargaris verticillata]
MVDRKDSLPSLSPLSSTDNGETTRAAPPTDSPNHTSHDSIKPSLSAVVTEKDQLMDNPSSPVTNVPSSPVCPVAPAQPRSFWARLMRRRGTHHTAESDPDTKSSENDSAPSVSFFQLFRFATGVDYLLILAGSLAAVATGVSLPLMTIIFSDIIQGFTDYTFIAQSDPDLAAVQLDDSVYKMMKWFGILAAGTFVAASIQVFCWSATAERQTRRMRELYYEAILRQEISWFDTVATGDLTARISGDVNIVQEGMGSKLGRLIQDLVTFLTGFIIAFIKGWKLALVLLAAFPLMAAAGSLVSVLIASESVGGQSSYGKAGGVAEEVISGIRTVMAFGGQESEIRRYDQKITEAMRKGIRKALIGGVGMGAINSIMFLTYALGFWYGVKLAAEGSLESSQVLNVFFALTIGAMSLGISAPNLTAVGSAQGAANKVFTIIDRQSPIDPLAESGRRLDQVQGRIEFRNIRFSYPTRPDVPILQGVSLTVEPGETVALVGASGSGKSTIVALLERFYDPTEGQVLLDGVDIRDLNVRYLRSQLGIVSQEPVLFGESIKQNIKWGAFDDDGSTVTDAMVEQACRDANAYDFIQRLHNKFDTLVGEKGSLLSGGQKQRIAIARAIIKNPQILLLDEATSALDTKSERLVQDALDRAAKNRTTIVIAHRLSTIKEADKIVVMNRGEVVEMGTHNSLLARNGAYAQLVNSQKLKQRKVTAAIDDDASSDDHLDDIQEDPSSGYLNTDSSNLPSLAFDSELHTTAEDESLPSDNVSEKQGVSSNKPSMFTASATLPLPADENEPLKRKHSRRHRRLKLGHRKTKKGKHQARDEGEKVTEEALAEKERRLLAKQKMPFKRLAQLNRSELAFIIPGSFFAAMDGAIQPCFAIVFTKMIGVFSEQGNPDKMREDGNFYALMFVVFAIASFIAVTGRVGLFDVSGERLTHRVRLLSFRSIVYQDAAFFDDRANGTGILCSKLSSESERIKIAGGRVVGVICKCISTMAVGMVLAFTHGWQLTLVILAILPVLVFSEVVHMKSLSGFEGKVKEAYDMAAQTAGETVANLRTVAALCRESMFIQMFRDTNQVPHRNAVRGFMVSAVASAFAQSEMYLTMIVCFYYGSRLVLDNTYTIEDMLQIVFAVMFTAIALSEAAQQVGDMTKAKIAALSIFRIVDRHPTIDVRQAGGHTVSDIQGHIDGHRVDFSYPLRPDIPVLQQVSLMAKPGQTIALVGNSGSGKSTMVALAQRLYDVGAGCVSVDQTDVREWELENLRSHMAIVGQEPVLFDMSIRDNIVYGKPDATMDEVEAAARSANIHEFIEKLPAGYDTMVGERGGQLSGGQKQRIAIARALIRNPKLLLLDEATSALDSQSEKLVQKTLDEAAKGRTTLTIAHRLSTIQNADLIVVFENGRVVETGTHFDLVDKHGLYHSLVQEQSLEATH